MSLHDLTDFVQEFSRVRLFSSRVELRLRRDSRGDAPMPDAEAYDPGRTSCGNTRTLCLVWSLCRTQHTSSIAQLKSKGWGGLFKPVLPTVLNRFRCPILELVVLGFVREDFLDLVGTF